MAHYSIKLYDKEDNVHTEEYCLYFRLKKELYLPYIYFEAKFFSSVYDVKQFARIEFYIYTRLMHRGLIDTVDIKHKNGGSVITIKSKSFTSLLCQNQPTPGMMTNVDATAIVASCPEIPYVTCESCEPENYIFIKDGSTVWDAIVNLAYRKSGVYPYIDGTNNVRVTKKDPSRRFTVADKNILEFGDCHDYTRLISDIHMQDTDGNYDIYNLSDSDAHSLGIVRHKHIPLDRQYLSEPDGALDYRVKYGKRGYRYHYLRYIGFYFEDLFDLVSYKHYTESTIHKLDLIFDGTKLTTYLGMYDDGFYPSN